LSPSLAPLRLTALSEADLEPVSAALQDAIAQLGDFAFAQRQRNFTMAFNRFCWEGGRRNHRVRTGLQIGSVVSAQTQNIRQGADDAVVNLLSIRFEPGEAPGGEIVLLFSGDGVLRLGVECIDLVMADVSQPWPAASRPEHQVEEE
jgi:hypothetical protein